MRDSLPSMRNITTEVSPSSSTNTASAKPSSSRVGGVCKSECEQICATHSCNEILKEKCKNKFIKAEINSAQVKNFRFLKNLFMFSYHFFYHTIHGWDSVPSVIKFTATQKI
jgi:hypothetical protein